MLTGAGLFATVTGIRSETEGFPTVLIGLVTAAYYLGFLGGSRLTLKLLGSVGHIRVYAALASLLSVAVLVTGMVVSPYAWILLRFVSGACLAGQYVVAESWLNQLVTNATRGRILSLYSLVTIVAYGIGQVSVGIIDPNTLTVFGIAAIVMSLAVAPVALSAEAAPPLIATPARMTLRELFAIVPTGVVTSVLVGVAHGSFLGLAAVYATRGGLSDGRIGMFVALPTIGSLLFQIPISAASDDIDRRAVGALAAFTAAAAAVLLVLSDVGSAPSMAAMVLIGGTTYPLYSIAGAYTNDWVPTEQADGRRLPARRAVRRRRVPRAVPRLDRDGPRRQRRLRLDHRGRARRDRRVPPRIGCSRSGRRCVPSRGTKSPSRGASSTCRPPPSAWDVASVRPGTVECRSSDQMR